MKKLVMLVVLMLGLLSAKALPSCITNVTITATTGTVLTAANLYGTGVKPYTDGYGNKGYQGTGLYYGGSNPCADSYNGVIITISKACGDTGYVDIRWECNPNLPGCYCENNGCRIVIPLYATQTSQQIKIYHSGESYNACILHVCDLSEAPACIPDNR